MNLIRIQALAASIVATAAGTPPPSLDTQNYRVTYIPGAESCRLASLEDAYFYTILAEDYMAQVNLISTLGASDPEGYYEANVAPRQSDDMQVIAPSVGLELSGKDVEQLFLTFARRELAYHIWAMPRACRLDDDDGRMRVFLRETGYVKNDDRDGDEEVEGYGNVFTVFTTIQLDFDADGKVTRLVSVRDGTLLGNEVYEGNAPVEPPVAVVELKLGSSASDRGDSGDGTEPSVDAGAEADAVADAEVDSRADAKVEPFASSSPSNFTFRFVGLHAAALAALMWNLF